MAKATKGTAAGKKTVAGKNGGTLNPPVPGEVRNPNGRGKGRLNNKTILNKLLGTMVKSKNPVTKLEEEMPVLEAMNIALIGKALKGDQRAYRELMDRFEGKPRQRVEIMGEDGGPIQTENRSEFRYEDLSDEALQEIVNAGKKKDSKE